MSEATTITEKTKVSLKTALSVIGAAIIGTGSWLSVKSDLAEIKSAQRQNWTRAEQSEWTQDLKDANPSIKVPRVRVTEAVNTAMKDQSE